MNRTINYTIFDDSLSIQNYLKTKGYTSSIFKQLKKNTENVLVNGIYKPLWTPLHSGDELTIFIHEVKSSPNIVPFPVSLSIVFEDDDILVLNKQSDCPIHPSQNNLDNTLANGVVDYYQKMGEPMVFRCINRLDRNTTGLTIIAKHYLSSAILSVAMINRTIQRTYLALVEGSTPDSGTINSPIDRVEGSTIERKISPLGEVAITHFKKISEKNGISLISLQLETGRTHQIRVHMKSIGFPLLGDGIYNPTNHSMDRQALHSAQLQFIHPVTGHECLFTQPLPADMESLI